MTQLVIVRIRGDVRLSKPIKDTLAMLRLKKKHACVLVEKTPSNEGMIKKVKDFITWGEVQADLAAELEKKMKDKVLHLHPPRGGFARKGIKVSFKAGGALGYRGDKIAELIQRML